MSMPWFRFYYKFMEDEKIQMLSEVDQRRFVMLLCVRCCNGNETLQDSEIAWKLRIDETQWKQTKKRLLEKNLIDESGKPTKWNKCQYVSDSSTERVRQHRKRQQKRRNGKETLQKRKRNGSVTPPDTDTDTDTDKKHKTICAKLPCGNSALEALPVINLPTNRFENHGEEFTITETMFDEFWRAYPAVDLRSELKKIRLWLLSNKSRRKTKRGMLRFVNSWLAKQHDGMPVKPVNQSTRNLTLSEQLSNRDWANEKNIVHNDDKGDNDDNGDKGDKGDNGDFCDD